MSVMKQHGKRRNMGDTSDSSPVFRKKLKSSSFEELAVGVTSNRQQ
jgi:hypothetical protein